MKYEGDVATIQQRMAETSDLYRRRLAVLEAVSVTPGERVLEVGCGGGALLPALAASAGNRGRVVGIDISADQIAAAAEHCTGIDNAEVAVGDVTALEYPECSFDAVVAIQVIEYLENPSAALAELRRVAALHARLIVLATNWDTMFWHSVAPDLDNLLQDAWRSHAPYPNLPAVLPPLLAGAGFRVVGQRPVTILNNALHEDVFAYWAARLIAAFAVGRGSVSQADADAWIEALDAAQESGTFFFSSTPVLTSAVVA